MFKPQLSKKVSLTIGLSFCLLWQSAWAATYLVGTGAGCQFNTIQAGVNAAASNPGPDTIRISNSNTWTAQAISIGAQDLTIDGNFPDCVTNTPSGADASISGQGGSAASVFTVTGSGVRIFQNLSIVRGDTSGNGGGINYEGTGEVVLENVALANNNANNGGAISAFGVGGRAVVSLLSNTTIQFNTATASGGGVVLRAESELYAEQDNTLIQLNEAGQFGGGIHISDETARANIGSPGFANTAVISGNTAQDGGGVSINDGVLSLFTTVANRSTAIRGNRARSKGGAIYANTGNARLCLSDFYLEGNRAQEGSAIYNEAGFFTHMNQTSNTCAPRPTAIPCILNISGCNLIENHVTETAAGVRTAGATLIFNTDSFGSLLARNVIIGNNFGAHVLRTIDIGTLELQNVLIASNGAASDPMTGSLLRLNFAASAADETLRIRNITIARNFFSAPQVIQFEDGPDKLNFNHNLVWQPNQSAVSLPFAIANSANYNWDFNSGSNVNMLPTPWNVSVADPRFVYPEGNNYRLRMGSPLVDMYPAVAPNLLFTPTDLDGRLRPVRMPLRWFSNADVGAFETQATDDLVINGTFFSSLLLWQSEAPAGTVTWNSSDSGTAAGTGSASVSIPGANIPANTLRMNALKYCFNVPGPAVYTVSARGFRNSGFNVDSPVLRWRVRNDSAFCDGSATNEGDAFFAAGSGWVNLAAPLNIPISIGQWTANTTIEIRLDVAEGNPAVSTSPGLSAGFDNVVMTGVATDSYHRDGFE